MNIFKEENYEAVCRRAANIISAQVIQNPKSVLGLATGTSPIGTYKQLIEWYEKGDVDFSNCISVNLDEYIGLDDENLNSYHHFMHQQFFDHINIAPENIHLPDGNSKDLTASCIAYDKLLEDLGNVDLQLLGLGHNGHIGFNEPSDEFPVGTHIVELSQNTIEANSRLFNSIDEVPTKAITMGIRDIMFAKNILLIVSGEDKADALYKTIYGPVTPNVPASILQLHKNVTIVADKAALIKCKTL